MDDRRPLVQERCFLSSFRLLAEDHSHADDGGRHRLVLEPYGYRWYRVGGLDYLLKRSDIDTDAAGKAAHPA